MKLNVSERLTLVGVVPEKGNFETMKTVEKVRDALFLSEEETKLYEVVRKNNIYTWNEEGSNPVEIEISEMGMDLIVKSLEGLSNREEMNMAQYLILKRIKEEQQDSNE